MIVDQVLRKSGNLPRVIEDFRRLRPVGQERDLHIWHAADQQILPHVKAWVTKVIRWRMIQGSNAAPSVREPLHHRDLVAVDHVLLVRQWLDALPELLRDAGREQPMPDAEEVGLD